MNPTNKLPRPSRYHLASENDGIFYISRTLERWWVCDTWITPAFTAIFALSLTPKSPHLYAQTSLNQASP
jgi:hypothetical protein